MRNILISLSMPLKFPAAEIPCKIPCSRFNLHQNPSVQNLHIRNLPPSMVRPSPLYLIHNASCKGVHTNILETTSGPRLVSLRIITFTGETFNTCSSMSFHTLFFVIMSPIPVQKYNGMLTMFTGIHQNRASSRQSWMTYAR